MKERRTVSALGAVLGAAACLLCFISLKKHSSANRAASQVQAMERGYQALSRSRDEVKKEGQIWMDAERDMKALKANYFYAGQNILRDLRLDLQQIFETAGISVTDINYGYSELVKGSIQLVTVEFHFSGNYAMFKRLLDTIERHPHFLLIEKLDFLSIGKQPGLLDLKISLAGYYEN